jgi:hypothetical protein
MRKPHRLIAFALLGILTVSVPSHGWWGLGHMAVAYVAYQQLTPQKRDRVDVLLRLNPDLPNWLALVPPDTSKEDERLMIFTNRRNMMHISLPLERGGFGRVRIYKRFAPTGARSRPQQ